MKNRIITLTVWVGMAAWTMFLNGTENASAAVSLEMHAGAATRDAVNDTPLYKDRNCPVDKRIDDLLGRMTIEEKIGQISHLHSWNVFDGKILNLNKLEKISGDVGFGFFEGFPLTAEQVRSSFREMQTYQLERTRLGIPAFPVAESLHGVVHEGATIYPQNVAMGSTFNPSLAYLKTRQISGELNTMGVKQVLAPCIDVVRDLRWGRVEESFGEDPFLCSRMAVAEVSGYLDNGISPMLKHYGPHGNPQGGINLASVECSLPDLFDVYLKPFEAVIAETGIMAVMSSYNSWNRIPNSASHFMMTEVLRGRFGFRGYVYSDWGSIDMLKYFHRTAADDFEAAAQALGAGLDVEASSSCYPALAEAIRRGGFDMEILDTAVRRVLRAKFESGLFDDPYLEGASYRLPLRAEESVALSRRIADESTVLLKNEGGLLPLDASKIKSIAVIGPNADNVQFGDYTWSKNNSDGVTPLQGIRSLVGDDMKIHYAHGCSLASLDESGIPAAVKAAKKSDVAIIFVGSSSTAFVRNSEKPSTSGEGIDLHDITLTGAQEKLIREVHATGTPVVVVLVAGKPFAMPWVKANVPAVLAQWYAGEQAGSSIADILFGNVNPSGRLSFSFPQSTGHLPVYYNHLPSDKGYYKEPGSYEKPGRDYVFASPDPLWAFGHGLSYTDFEYIGASTDRQSYGACDTIAVNVLLKNTGEVKGKEVIQVYVRDVVSSVVTPVKQLKGFSKVELNPGEVKNVSVSIPVKELYLTRDNGDRFLEPGEFEIQVGTASDKISHIIKVWAGTEAVMSKDDGTVQEANVAEGEMIRIEGEVRDVQATPIAGVRVSVSGGDFVKTDAGGHYVVNANSKGTLTFAKKGFKTKTVEISDQKTISVRLDRTN